MSGTSAATETISHGASLRRLEIGPRDIPVEGYEHLDIVPGPHIEYVADASGSLPFQDETFDEIYASHVIEHIPWYRTEQMLREWFRILKPGGHMEIWTPDLEVICRRYVKRRNLPRHKNEFRKLNPENNLQLWVNLKLFWYDRRGYQEEWHRAMFDFELLRHYLTKVGCDPVYRLYRHEIKGPDHGITEFGVRAFKHGEAKELLRARRAEVRTFRTRQFIEACRARPKAACHACFRFSVGMVRALVRRARYLDPRVWRRRVGTRRQPTALAAPTGGEKGIRFKIGDRRGDISDHDREDIGEVGVGHAGTAAHEAQGAG
jgi:predicted SAM-dependent methyltransferase